jgi:hypothetical protein
MRSRLRMLMVFKWRMVNCKNPNFQPECQMCSALAIDRKGQAGRTLMSAQGSGATSADCACRTCRHGDRSRLRTTAAMPPLPIFRAHYIDSSISTSDCPECESMSTVLAERLRTAVAAGASRSGATQAAGGPEAKPYRPGREWGAAARGGGGEDSKGSLTRQTN